jgi:hypothetical protein
MMFLDGFDIFEIIIVLAGERQTVLIQSWFGESRKGFSEQQ